MKRTLFTLLILISAFASNSFAAPVPKPFLDYMSLSNNVKVVSVKMISNGETKVLTPDMIHFELKKIYSQLRVDWELAAPAQSTYYLVIGIYGRWYNGSTFVWDWKEWQILAGPGDTGAYGYLFYTMITGEQVDLSSGWQYGYVI
jgi:hypothetical protein